MNHHMGILGPQPSKVVQWLQTVSWSKAPEHIIHDFHVTILTPGFPLKFWATMAKLDYYKLQPYKNSLDVEKYKEDAIKNYESITQDDVMQIAKLKPYYAAIPLPLALGMVEDVNKGMTQTAVAEKYNTTRMNVHKIVKYPAQHQGRFMPDWFRSRIPGF